MSKALITEAYLTNIADAIRAKNGSSDTYTPPQMAAAIGAIPTGGDVTVEALSVTQNGTYIAPTGKAYSPVTVNVSGGGSVYAFVRVIYLPGNTITASDGTTTQNGDTSGDYIFALPNGGTWTFTSGGNTTTLTPTYASSNTTTTLNIVSLVPVLSSLTGSNGVVIYNDAVNFNWNSADDVWKAFDGNLTDYGQYKSENQSGFWIGYQFNAPVYVDNIVWRGGNYATSDVFEVIAECYVNGAWQQIESFSQASKDTSPKTIDARIITAAIRFRSPTTKTPGHNLFIYELTINGTEI